MSTKTTNFEFIKPELTDAPPDITVLNQNWDKIDNELKEVEEALSKASNASGKRVNRFTVGTSTSGWKVEDCDYLCDGTADEAQINEAIQALPNGGEIVLLDGSYTLTGAILINKDNVTLKGNGANTKIIRAFNDDEYDDDQGLIVITNSFCVVKNLYFNGVKGSYTSNSIINLYSGNNCTITYNTIENSSCDGILANCDNHTISDNTITNCGGNYSGNGVYLQKCNNCVISNNNITASGSLGIYLYNVKNTVINNNLCLNNVDSGIKANWCDRVTFTGNVLHNNTQCGLFIARGEHNIVSGNTIVANAHYGIYLQSYVTETIVANNVIADNTTGSINDAGTDNITGYAPMYTYGTTDLTAGSSNLKTGTMYIVYE